MVTKYKELKPDSIIGSQTLLYSKQNPNIVGNAFLNPFTSIFIMYDNKGNHIESVVETNEVSN